MKEYKVGDIVKYTAEDFDGKVSMLAVITDVAPDRALATEITPEPKPAHLYIDDDTDFMFTIRKEWGWYRVYLFTDGGGRRALKDFDTEREAKDFIDEIKWKDGYRAPKCIEKVFPIPLDWYDEEHRKELKNER